jgi:hypothetical protein
MELDKFIHISTSTTLRDLMYELPRFRLSFSLESGLLKSLQFRGYHVRCSDSALELDKHLPMSLPSNLARFLPLYPDSASAPILILVSDGNIKMSLTSCDVKIHLSISPRAQMRYHVYSLDARTQLLSAPTVESRLFLAALYAAGGCDVPLPVVGCTGQEMALTLLRQCTTNRPLSPAESSNLKALASFSSHTPALRLLCASYAELCNEVSFLWDVLPNVDVPWPDAEQRMYEQERRRLPEHFQHARRDLSDYESRIIINAADMDHSKIPFRKRDVMAALEPVVERKAVREFQVAASAIGQQIIDAQPPPVIQAHQVPFDCQELGQNATGKAFIEKLTDSLAVVDGMGDEGHLEKARLPRRAARAMAKACEDLQLLSQNVHIALHRLQESLLSTLALATPESEGEWLMVLFRSSGLIATPAVSDLVMLKVNSSLAQVRSCQQICI